MKIINKLTSNLQISLEFFPPKTPKGIENLNTRLSDMITQNQPVFIDLTWGAGGSQNNTKTLQLTREWHQSHHPKTEINMHITCVDLTPESLDEILAELSTAGIHNIVALRGDPPDSPSSLQQSFTCALDLIKYIREHHPQFNITVAGYPEGHPDLFESIPHPTPTEQQRMVTYDGQSLACPDAKYEESLQYLKAKSQYADMIITQLFFDCDLYLKFVRDCRRIGITIPIIPGIMLIQSYPGFQKMTRFCKTKVPTEILESLESLSQSPSQLQEYALHLAQEMCTILVEKGQVDHLHFYTLNKSEPTNSLIQYLKQKYPQLTNIQ